jgi:hypothetical protein
MVIEAVVYRALMQSSVDIEQVVTAKEAGEFDQREEMRVGCTYKRTIKLSYSRAAAGISEKSGNRRRKLDEV